MKARYALIIAVMVATMAISTATRVQARPPGVPANDIERGAFVDPVPGRGQPARGSGGAGSSLGELDTSFSYKGIHWSSSTVHYSVNSHASGLSARAADAAVGLGFWTWEAENNVLGRADQSSIIFVNDGATASSGVKLDGVNTVSWAALSSSTLAATYYWYNRRTKQLVEFDLVFNSAVPWSTTGEAGKYDVWDIAAHEAGHTLQLGDLYNRSDSELTMYGYGASGETKKQTLGMGDMLGIERIYPAQ